MEVILECFGGAKEIVGLLLANISTFSLKAPRSMKHGNDGKAHSLSKHCSNQKQEGLLNHLPKMC